MTDWKVGDEAVCVEARNCPLSKGVVYTVAACFHDPALNDLGQWSEYSLLLQGVSLPRGKTGFCVSRFRKVVRDKHEACEPEFVTLLKRSKVSA